MCTVRVQGANTVHPHKLISQGVNSPQRERERAPSNSLRMRSFDERRIPPSQSYGMMHNQSKHLGEENQTCVEDDLKTERKNKSCSLASAHSHLRWCMFLCILWVSLYVSCSSLGQSIHSSLYLLKLVALLFLFCCCLLHSSRQTEPLASSSTGAGGTASGRGSRHGGSHKCSPTAFEPFLLYRHPWQYTFAQPPRAPARPLPPSRPLAAAPLLPP